MTAEKIELPLTFADFNAIDVLVTAEISQAAHALRCIDPAQSPEAFKSGQRWLSRLRHIEKQVSAMRPPDYARKIRENYHAPSGL
jgi:hypothetical protein